MPLAMPRSRKRLLEITYETIREKYGGLSVPRYLLKLAAKPREWLLQKVDFRTFVGMCHLGTRQYELTVNVFLLLSSSWVALTYTFCLPAYHICRTQCTAEHASGPRFGRLLHASVIQIHDFSLLWLRSVLDTDNLWCI